jgi:hypothetical protein
VLKAAAVLVPPNVNEIVVFVVVLPFVKLIVALVLGGFNENGLIIKGDPVRNILLGAGFGTRNKPPITPRGISVKICTGAAVVVVVVVVLVVVVGAAVVVFVVIGAEVIVKSLSGPP